MKTIVLDLETDFTIKEAENGKEFSDFGRPFNKGSNIVLWCVNEDGHYHVGHSGLGLKLYINGLIAQHGRIAIVAHNAKYEGLWLKAIGVDITKIRFICTQLREYLIGCGQYELRHTGLDVTAPRYGGTNKNDIISLYFKQGIGSSDIPNVLLERYCVSDVGNTTLIYNGQMQNPDLQRQWRMVRFMEDVLITLIEMEYAGLSFNADELPEVRKELDKKAAEAERRLMKAIEAVCGPEKTKALIAEYEKKGKKLFDSPPAMSKIIYGMEVNPAKKAEFKAFAAKWRPTRKYATRDLTKAIDEYCIKLDYGAKVKPAASWLVEAQVVKNAYIGLTGFSANAKLLEAFKEHGDANAKQQELIEAFLDYNKIDNWRTTSLSQMLKGIADDGMIHGNFNQLGTVTGRLSSSNPNMQNFPREGTVALKKLIKSRYEDGRIVQADYGQLEFRVVGMIANDNKLIQDVNNDFDIHSNTAKIAYKDKYGDLVYVNVNDETDTFTKSTVEIIKGYQLKPTKEQKPMRQKAKNQTFKFQYGGMPVTEEAKAIFGAFYGKYLKVAAWQEETVARVGTKKEYVCPYTGRVFAFPDASLDNTVKYSTKVKNYPVQFLSAVVTQSAQILVHQKIVERGKDDMRLILQVHDSLAIDCKPEAVKAAAKILKESMEGVGVMFQKYFGKDITIPLTTDLECGKTYLGGDKI